MGIQNTVTKNYMSRNDIFAELFNYYVFHGRQILKPEDLREADTAENVILTDNNGQSISIEKYRDILKQGVLKLAEKTGFLCIGLENQSEIHYAMPVRSMLYDSLTYVRQISETTKEHRKRKDKMSDGEFLSGFTRDDRLIPVITLVVYFGQKVWTGPCSLHEMLCCDSPDILNCITNYRMNLIDPHRMSEEDFSRMGASLQYVMRFIGVSGNKEAMKKLLGDFKEEYSHMERDAAELLKACTKVEIPIKENEEVVDMCKAWEDMKEECIEKGIEKGIQKGEENGRKQIKAAVKEIKKGYNTVEMLVSRGFSEDIALDAVEIVGQFL